MLKKIFRKLAWHLRIFISYLRIRYLSICRSKRIFLLGTPWYGNIGDQAIALGELEILQRLFLASAIIDVPYMVFYSVWSRCLGLGIERSDKIFLQGGGNLGSLYPQEERLRRDVIRRYQKNQIIIMPVSIFFHDNQFGRSELAISSEIYNQAENLTVIARDETSWKFAKKHFAHANNVLAPDAVTVLDGITALPRDARKGITFFLRADKEKVVAKEILQELQARLRQRGMAFQIADTTVRHDVYTEQRQSAVMEKLALAASSRLVITDRFHGVVFSVITHTPVIAFKSFDTKISSGIKWFSDLPWVYYVEGKSLDEVEAIIAKWEDGEEDVFPYSKCGEKIIEAVRRIVL